MDLVDGFGLRPSEVRHIFGRDTERPGLNDFERGPVEAAACAEGPGSFDDCDVLIDLMGVGEDDISGVLVDAKHEGLAGFAGVAPYLFDPLALLELVQRH